MKYALIVLAVFFVYEWFTHRERVYARWRKR